MSASQIIRAGHAWDVKTKTRSGLMSRRVVANGEKLTYATSDPAVAEVFDRMLDRICVREEP